MAQTQRNPSEDVAPQGTPQNDPTPTPATANELWAGAAARCGYAVHNGKPLIGISGDEGDGFLVSLEAPEWFAAIKSEGAQDNAFRAYAGHALRVGQAKVKAAETPTREIAQEGVNASINGTHKPGKDRSSDILDSEASKQFEAHVTKLVMAAAPNATEGDIALTITEQAKTPNGQKWLADRKAAIVAAGTYTVSRKKTKGGKAVAVSLA